MVIPDGTYENAFLQMISVMGQQNVTSLILRAHSPFPFPPVFFFFLPGCSFRREDNLAGIFLMVLHRGCLGVLFSFILS
jgi:hypothetical protein